MVGWYHDSMDMSLSKLREMVKGRAAWQLWSTGWQRVEHDRAAEQQLLTVLLKYCFIHIVTH